MKNIFSCTVLRIVAYTEYFIFHSISTLRRLVKENKKEARRVE